MEVVVVVVVFVVVVGPVVPSELQIKPLLAQQAVLELLAGVIVFPVQVAQAEFTM